MGNPPTGWTSAGVEPAAPNGLVTLHYRFAITVQPVADTVTMATSAQERAGTFEIFEGIFVSDSDTNGVTTETATAALKTPKQYLLGSGADGNFAALADGVDQTAASRTDGWTVAKTAAGNASDFDAGTKQLATSFATASGKPSAILIGTTANAFKTPAVLNGGFVAGAWILSFAVRAVTLSAQAGRARVRVYKGSAADGSNAVELTSGTQVGSTTGTLSTTVDVVSTVTWVPGAITLNNEYLFFVVAWEITTQSGSTSADVVLRTGQAAAGTGVVTSSFTPSTPISATDANGTTTESASVAVAPLTLIDDFNRANGAIYAGAGAAIWTGHGIGNTTPATNSAVIGNQAGVLAANASCASLLLMQSDFDMTWDCVVAPGGGAGANFYVCLSNYDQGTWNGIAIGYNAGTWYATSYTAGSGSPAGSAASAAIQAGETYLISKRGTTVSFFKSTTGGPFTLIMSFGVAGTFGAGAFGTVFTDTTQRWDNLRGGPLAPIPISSTDANGATTESASFVAQLVGTDPTGPEIELATLVTQLSASDLNGTTTEAATPNTLVASTDTNGTTTESQSVNIVQAVSATDTNGTTTEAQSVVVSISTSDATGTATEAQSVKGVVSTADVNGTVTEVGTAVQGVVPISGSDSGSGSETATVKAVLAVADGMAGVSYHDTIVGGGPYAYYRLGESSGTSAAEEISGYSGTFVGSHGGPTLGQAGIPGGQGSTAIGGTGGDSVALTNLPVAWTFNQNFTFEAWHKLTSSGDVGLKDYGIVGAWRNTIGNDLKMMIWADFFSSTGNYGVAHDDSPTYLTSTVAPTLNVWHHLVATYEFAAGVYTWRFYVDGILADTKVHQNPSIPSPTNYFEIGSYAGGTQNFVGVIDETAFYQRALAPAEILNHYNVGMGLVSGGASETATVNTSNAISASDSGSGSDSATLKVAVSSSDAGLGSESQSLAAGGLVSSSDTNLPVTESPVVRAFLTSSEVSGPTTEFALAPAGSLPGFDTGTGSDLASLIVKVAATDLNGTTTETAAPAVPVLTIDAGTSSESTSVSVKLTATDSGTDSESAATGQGAAVSGSDSGSAVEGAFVLVLVTSVDHNGVAVESASLLFLTQGSDLGTGIESASILARISTFDAGIETSSGSVVVRIFALDSGTATEIVTGQAFSTGDSGAGLDLETLRAAINDSDLGYASDDETRWPPLSIFPSIPAGSILGMARGEVSSPTLWRDGKIVGMARGDRESPATGRILK